MPANTKEVKLRLQSIKNTRKITKAMELVSAAKTRRAVSAALETRLYHRLAWNVAEKILSARRDFSEDNPTRRFFEKAIDPKHIIIVVFTSNRGLCGAFNANAIKLVLDYIQKTGKEKIGLVSVGNKGTAAFSSLGLKIDFAAKKNDSARDDLSIITLSDYLYNKFLNKETDLVLTVYTDFGGMLKQTPVMRQLFPLPGQQKNFTGIEAGPAAELAEKAEHIPAREYVFEPNKFAVLEFLAPRLGEVELYQNLLESNASEHSARMLAMKNASDAAEEMAQDLTLEYNKARQGAITREIAEISAAAGAIN